MKGERNACFAFRKEGRNSELLYSIGYMWRWAQLPGAQALKERLVLLDLSGSEGEGEGGLPAARKPTLFEPAGHQERPASLGEPSPELPDKS